MTIEHARSRRSERAELLSQVVSGELTLQQLLRARTPACLASATLWSVLLRSPGMGKASARRVCEDAQVWPLTSMSSLTKDQRRRIIDSLP